MNASASVLTREDEVQSKVRNVRKFGRGARAVCAAIFGFGVVGSVVMALTGALGVGPAGGIGVAGLEPVTTAQFTAEQLNTPQLKVWAFLALGLQAGVALTAVYQLYRLFGDLAAGAIYTQQNVRRVRYVGVLWVLSTLLALVIPFAAALLVQLGFLLPSNQATSSS